MPRGAKPKHQFTQEEDCRIEELRIRGVSLRKIAASMGLTERILRIHCKKIDCPSPMLMEARYAIHVCQPHDVTTLARQLGIKPGSLRAIKYELRRRGFNVFFQRRNRKRR